MILVTGGAGYIGSTLVCDLCEKGAPVVVFDDLSTGKKRFVDPRAQFVQGDITKVEDFKKLQSFSITAVVHLAAKISVAESMSIPGLYQRVNIEGTKNVLNFMKQQNIRKLIFPSTAVVYGVPDYVPLDEDHPLRPVNIYGETKLVSESDIRDFADKNNIEHIIFRFFNVAGDSGISYDHSSHYNLFPALLYALKHPTKKFSIFGNDYDTPDGTAVRDYIHVSDISTACQQALVSTVSVTFNLSTGQGSSVQQVRDAFVKVAEVDIPTVVQPRRAGDAPCFYASAAKAQQTFGWQPQFNLEDMVRSSLASL